ncbi:MAG: hypothetical protein J5372_09600 [Lachnospiraceae bacterium]|nr:hypothetical protein [Lachnospiraceae bacterium]
MGIFEDFKEIMRVKKEKSVDNKISNTTTPKPDEILMDVESQIKKDVRNVLSDKVPEVDIENVIEQVCDGGAVFPSDYFINEFPIETWESLSPDKLKIAQDNWFAMSNVITERYYHFYPIESKSTLFGSYSIYIEIRYDGYPKVDYETLENLEEQATEKINGMKIRTKTKDANIKEIKDYMKYLLNKVNIGVRVTDIFVKIW